MFNKWDKNEILSYFKIEHFFFGYNLYDANNTCIILIYMYNKNTEWNTEVSATYTKNVLNV